MTEYEAIARFYENNSESLRFFREHGVLPKEVNCPKCTTPCVLRSDRPQWQCTSKIRKPKRKKRVACGAVISDFKGSFLEKCRFANPQNKVGGFG